MFTLNLREQFPISVDPFVVVRTAFKRNNEMFLPLFFLHFLKTWPSYVKLALSENLSRAFFWTNFLSKLVSK